MAIAGVGGFLSAALSLLYLIPIPGLVFFSYFAPLPLFLIGLGVGLRPLYGAGLLSTALIFLFEGPFSAGQYFVLTALGSAFLVNRALLNRKTSSKEISWYPSSFLLRDFTLYLGIIMLLGLGVYLYITQNEDMHKLVKSFLEILDPNQQIKGAEALLLKLLPTIPGCIALIWGMVILFNSTLAQGILSHYKKNLRPTPTLEDLEVSWSFLLLLCLSLLLSIIGVGSLEILGKNAAIVLIVPFFLVGLGLVHKWLRKTSFAMAALTFFYLILFLFLWPALFVIILGILKPWIEKSTQPN
ncbi:MAG: DUF2232 domain-containing protein [Alphaproteobacteria bacterium]|nr:DUF2232 domain-containing protein [Alphaproteobacteria bacterium]